MTLGSSFMKIGKFFWYMRLFDVAEIKLELADTFANIVDGFVGILLVEGFLKLVLKNDLPRSDIKHAVVEPACNPQQMVIDEQAVLRDAVSCEDWSFPLEVAIDQLQDFGFDLGRFFARWNLREKPTGAVGLLVPIVHAV